MQTLLCLLLPRKPLWSWTSPHSGDNYGSPLRSPPVRAEPAEHAPTPRAPFLSGSPFPAEHPAFLAQAGLATFLPVWRSPRLAGPQETLLSRSAPARELPAEGLGALTPCPGPGGLRVERTRAPRPSPQAARLPLQRLPRGEGAGGAPDAAQQTCSGCAPHSSSPREAAAAAAAAAPRGCRGGERASPPRPAPQPGPRAQPRSRPGLASRHGFPPGTGARVLALPAGGRRVRREVSGPRGALSASFPTLISHGPRAPSLERWRCRRGVSPSRSWATASPRREESRRAALTSATPRPSRISETQLPAPDQSLERREARARHLGSEGLGQPLRGGDARGIPLRGTCRS